MNIQGSIVALVTPFNRSGNVNYDRLGQLIDWHIAEGTDGLVILGTTGEGSTLTHDESCAICEYTVERVDGRIPVIAGSGSNCTQSMLEKSIAYQQRGVDGLLVISPYYNKSNREGMYRHFSEIADQVEIPCILYNVPGRTGCAIPVDVVERLAAHENVGGLKEASGDLAYAAQVARYVNEGFSLFSGNDDVTVPMMALGASGVISVLANIMPRQTHDMVQSFLDGRLTDARTAQLAYLTMINALFMEVNPIPVKAAMNLMGLDVGGYRLPLYPMPDDSFAALQTVTRESGLI